MSYYLLPNNNKSNLSFKLETADKENDFTPFISHSLFFYYKQLNNKLEEIQRQIEPSNNIICNEMLRNIHPYEYIYNKVSGSSLSVSKIREKTPIFYDIFEILNTMNVFECFDHSMNILSFGKDKQHVIDCIEISREKYGNDVYHSFEEINASTIQEISNSTFDFIFYETNLTSTEMYINSFIRILLFVIHYLNEKGSIIIKIGETFDKPILELIYILTTIFSRTYIIKPNSSNIITFEKYIVCKGFISNPVHKQYSHDLFKILDELNNKKGKKIVSLLDNCQLPYYFLNKLDDLNIIIGQQQLETFNLWINILKNKNRDDKIEIQKRTNIQRCITWCERLNIPCNRFPERLNMFLPILSDNL